MSAEFVAHMEEVLDLYEEPYDPRRPVVCCHETSTQLLAQTRPLSAAPARNSAAAGLRVPEGGRPQPVPGLRAAGRLAARGGDPTAHDGGFAQQMRWLVDEAYPEVEVVRVVLDNLNTHRMASLYEASRQRRPRIAKRLGSTTPPSTEVG